MKWKRKTASASNFCLTTDKLINSKFQTAVAENHLEWMEWSTPSWTSSKSTNRRENPTTLLSRADTGQLGDAWVYHFGGQEEWDFYFYFFLGDLASPGRFKEVKDSEGFIGCKMSGPVYQGALWESQWEWSRRGNDSCYLFKREQKQTATRRNMIENADRAWLNWKSCF